jgi:hypothetical protein
MVMVRRRFARRRSRRYSASARWRRRPRWRGNAPRRRLQGRRSATPATATAARRSPSSQARTAMAAIPATPTTPATAAETRSPRPGASRTRAATTCPSERKGGPATPGPRLPCRAWRRALPRPHNIGHPWPLPKERAGTQGARVREPGSGAPISPRLYDAAPMRRLGDTAKLGA